VVRRLAVKITGGSLAAPQPETFVGGLKKRLDRLVGGEDRSVRVLATELRGLVVAYAKQETVDPLKKLVRFVLWGVIGSFFLAVGSLLLTLAAVRVLQSETGSALTGNLSWVPYAGGILFALGVLAFTAMRILAGMHRASATRSTTSGRAEA
jgi:hypothetical protein